MGIINALLSVLLIVVLLFLPRLSPSSSSPTATTAESGQDYPALYGAEVRKNQELQKKIRQLEEKITSSTRPKPTTPRPPSFSYSGQEILQVINDYRRHANVGELSPDPNLCYLASLRLSQLLDLGKLDAHQGFIDFDPANKFQYERVGEDLAYGYPSAQDVVDAWETSPGHNLVLRDPVNTLGCVAANRGYAVFIAGREH